MKNVTKLAILERSAPKIEGDILLVRLRNFSGKIRKFVYVRQVDCTYREVQGEGRNFYPLTMG